MLNDNVNILYIAIIASVAIRSSMLGTGLQVVLSHDRLDYVRHLHIDSFAHKEQ